MRNFFVYARSKDNQFFSCSIVVDCLEGVDADKLAERISDAATKRFIEMGNPLPHANDLIRFRAIMDPRNDLDESNYPCPIRMIEKPSKNRFKPFKTIKRNRNV